MISKVDVMSPSKQISTVAAKTLLTYKVFSRQSHPFLKNITSLQRKLASFCLIKGHNKLYRAFSVWKYLWVCVYWGCLQSWSIEVLGSAWLFDSDIAHMHRLTSLTAGTCAPLAVRSRSTQTEEGGGRCCEGKQEGVHRRVPHILS